MLMVRARKGPSAIHGVGLIAAEFIAAGTTVWSFRPGFDSAFPEGVLATLSEEARRQVLHYAFYDVPARRWVLSADDDRFTNHSDDANTAEVGGGYDSVATRDVCPGEELTWNYGKDWRGGGRYDPAAVTARGRSG